MPTVSLVAMTMPGIGGEAVDLRLMGTEAFAPQALEAVRGLVFTAFGGDRDAPFDEADWQHALGGVHAVAELDGRVVGHAAVVPRALEIDGRPVRTGYVEAVGVLPELQLRGIGTLVMRAAAEHIAEVYDLGALSTGDQSFYERLGWRVWKGPTSVRRPDRAQPTPDEDGGIMVLVVPSTPDWLDLAMPISCEWRDGDAW